MNFVPCCAVFHRYAAELGAAVAAGPGSLRVGLIDNLHYLAEGADSQQGRQRLLKGLNIDSQP